MSNAAELFRRIKAYWRYSRRYRTRLRLLILRFYLWLIPTESQRVLGLTLIVGAVCGLVAVAFHVAILAAEDILIDQAYAREGGNALLLLILIPAFGGLLCDFALHYLVTGALGCGIPKVTYDYV